MQVSCACLPPPPAQPDRSCSIYLHVQFLLFCPAAPPLHTARSLAADPNTETPLCVKPFFYWSKQHQTPPVGLDDICFVSPGIPTPHNGFGTMKHDPLNPPRPSEFAGTVLVPSLGI